MKKIMMMALVALTFVGCSKDDSTEPQKPQCDCIERQYLTDYYTVTNPDGSVQMAWTDHPETANPVKVDCELNTGTFIDTYPNGQTIPYTRVRTWYDCDGD